MLEPKEQGESIILRFLTDDNGKIQTDIICPVACGKCCGYWMGVKELKFLTVRVPLDGSPPKCPHLRSKGCHLKRTRRPLECKIYICELGVLVLEGLVDKTEIEACLKAGKQVGAFDFLGKYPETRERKGIAPGDIDPDVLEYVDKWRGK